MLVQTKKSDCKNSSGERIPVSIIAVAMRKEPSQHHINFVNTPSRRSTPVQELRRQPQQVWKKIPATNFNETYSLSTRELPISIASPSFPRLDHKVGRIPAATLKKDASDRDITIGQLEKELEDQKLRCDQLENQVLESDVKDRKLNLLIHGMPTERLSQTVEENVKFFLSVTMEISDPIQLTKCYRMLGGSNAPDEEDTDFGDSGTSEVKSGKTKMKPNRGKGAGKLRKFPNLDCSSDNALDNLPENCDDSSELNWDEGQNSGHAGVENSTCKKNSGPPFKLSDFYAVLYEQDFFIE
ncbi:hypothetical protein QYM36_001170 [Artemia franciscana]|uniref:Uncharacterized protein n=1 Tax=Artemia franciscana TaxID=6661 RepID=A0AA88ICE0_ARTSF|nr:hypothetical protein QYM36_001170 [Artemia franciscana]